MAKVAKFPLDEIVTKEYLENKINPVNKYRMKNISVIKVAKFSFDESATQEEKWKNLVEKMENKKCKFLFPTELGI